MILQQGTVPLTNQLTDRVVTLNMFNGSDEKRFAQNPTIGYLALQTYFVAAFCSKTTASTLNLRNISSLKCVNPKRFAELSLVSWSTFCHANIWDGVRVYRWQDRRLEWKMKAHLRKTCGYVSYVTLGELNLVLRLNRGSTRKYTLKMFHRVPVVETMLKVFYCDGAFKNIFSQRQG